MTTVINCGGVWNPNGYFPYWSSLVGSVRVLITSHESEYALLIEMMVKDA